MFCKLIRCSCYVFVLLVFLILGCLEVDDIDFKNSVYGVEVKESSDFVFV